mgnify:FL=1
MTAKEALNKLDLNIGEISPTAHSLCEIIKKDLEELDRYRLLCYVDLPVSCSTIILPNGIKVTADTGCIDDFFNNSDVKKWLKTGI